MLKISLYGQRSKSKKSQIAPPHTCKNNNIPGIWKEIKYLSKNPLWKQPKFTPMAKTTATTNKDSINDSPTKYIQENFNAQNQ